MIHTSNLHAYIKYSMGSNYRIAVAGTGYVGLSIATLLAQNNHVTAVDIIPERIESINNKRSPIQDEYIQKYFLDIDLDLSATLDGSEAYRRADFVVIAAPTNYDPAMNYFDTHCIEDIIDLVLSVNPDAVMVIKSTIPVGYCRSLYVKYAARGVRRFNLLFFLSFCVRAKRFTTICIHRGLSWVFRNLLTSRNLLMRMRLLWLLPI